ncbi:MAG: hypothetical protein AB8G95_26555 [Anaerolineae bacterium]
MDTTQEKNSLTHAEVQMSLSHATASLSAEESLGIKYHLEDCESCADFAQMLTLLKNVDTVGYPKPMLTLKEKAEIVRQLDTKIDRSSIAPVQNRSLNLIGSAVVAMVAILIVGAFVFSLDQPQLSDGSGAPTVDNLSETLLETPTSSNVQYDGWELGVAFDIPDVWAKSELVVEQLNGDGIVLAMGNEIYDLTQDFPPSLKPEETFGFVLVDNPGFKWAGSPTEQLEQFHKAGPGIGKLYEIAGRWVLVTEDELSDPSTGIVIHTLSGSLQIGGRFVRVTIFGRFEDENDKVELFNLLNEIVFSSKPVDYTGWKQWKHSQEGFTIAHPEQLNLSDLNDDTLTFEELEPSNALRFLIDYDQNVVAGDTLSEALDNLIVDFEEPGLVGERWSPPYRPDMLFGKYDLGQADGMTILGAVLENPNGGSQQPYFASWLLIEDTNLDIYQTQFEAIMRSIRWEDVPLFPSFLERGENTQKTRRAVAEEFTLSGSAVKSGLKLYWADWDRRIVRPGDMIELNFEWQTVKPMSREYNLFVHLLNSEGEVVAQLDSEPVTNLKPTSTWAIWAIVVGQHELFIPDDLPAGEYSLIMGHYDVDSGARLQIDQSDHLFLDTILVVQRDNISSEIEGIVSVKDVGMEFSTITFNDEETLIEFVVSMPELDLPTYQNQAEPIYQFGFPTALAGENGLAADILEISILGTEGPNRTQILKFPSISDFDKLDSMQLDTNYLFRDFPADRFISVDWDDLVDGAELTLNETVLINNVLVKIETLKWLSAEETVQIQLAPEHDLDQYVLLSVWATAIADEQEIGTSAGSVGPDLWDFGLGKIIINLLLSATPEAEFELYFTGDIQYLERHEFVLEP